MWLDASLNKLEWQLKRRRKETCGGDLDILPQHQSQLINKKKKKKKNLQNVRKFLLNSEAVWFKFKKRKMDQ